MAAAAGINDQSSLNDIMDKSLSAKRDLKWGKIIEARLSELDITQSDFAHHMKCYRQNIRLLIKQGVSHRQFAAKYAEPLGLDQNGNVATDTPNWIVTLKRQKTEEKQEKIAKNKRDATAANRIIKARGGNVTKFSKRISTNKSSGKVTTPPWLAHQLFFNDIDSMVAHAENIKDYDKQQIVATIDDFGVAQRLLRTKWNLSGQNLADKTKEKNSEHCLSKVGILCIENPNNPYGHNRHVAPYTLVNLLGTLYDIDQSQPEAERLFSGNENLEMLSWAAERTGTLPNISGNLPITEGLSNKIIQAMKNVIDAAAHIEPELDTTTQRNRVGFRHPLSYRNNSSNSR